MGRLLSSSLVALVFSAVVLVCGCSYAAAAVDKAKAESNDENVKADAYVIEMTDKTFDATLAAHPAAFIMFYAPWCQHSKKMKTTFSKAALADHPKVTYGRIDASVEKETAKKYNIKAFPTLIFFRNQKASEPYDGGRSETDLTRYTSAMFAGAVRVFQNKESWDTYRSDQYMTFALCVEDPKSPLCHNYHEAADTHRGMRGLRFMALKDPARAMAREFGIEQYFGKIVVVRAQDDGGAIVPIVETTDVARMRHEIQMQALPNFGELAPDTYKSYMAVKLPMLYLFVSDVSMSKAADKEAFNNVRRASAEFKGKVTFVFVDATKYAGMAPRVGLPGDKFPAVAIDHQGTFYTFNGQEITYDAIQRFVLDYISNKLPRAIRSEKAPTQHTVDGLTTVTGKTFEQLVTNAETEHVFLVMSAPFCVHCKEMMPALGEVAKKMKDEDITVAKMDATVNDYDKKKFPVYGFPTMYYIKKGAESGPEEYTGGRSTEDLLTFLRDKVDAE